MRVILLLAATTLCLLLSTTQAQDPTTDQVLKNASDQAQETIKTIKEQNHRGLAERTLPKVIEMVGGIEKFIATVDRMMSEMKAEGFTISSVSVQPPKPVIAGKDGLYVVVPSQMVLTQTDGTRLSQASFLLGLSTDKGRTWRFVDGSGLKARDVAKQVLPNLPSELELPKREQPTIQRP